MTTQGFVNNRYTRVKEYDVPVSKITTRTARKLPSVDDLNFSEVVSLDIGFLFCDIKGYTKLVDDANDPKVIARIMTIYITEMAAAIRHHDGTVLSIRGDGIIAAFTGENAPDEIIRCSVSMATLLKYVVNKRLKEFKQEKISCRFGGSYGNVKITRAGIRGDGKNDLIYIGSAINYAAKFSAIVSGGKLGVSKKLYNKISKKLKNKENGWNWTAKTNKNYGDYYVLGTDGWTGISEPK